MMQWADSNGTPARVGMTCADMKLTHPSSGSPDIVNVVDDSNAGEDGKYVYCLTDLTEPIREYIVYKFYFSYLISVFLGNIIGT